MKPLNVIVILLAITLLAFAIYAAFFPHYGTPMRSESGPISALRTVSSAQELYFTRYGTYGTLAQLDAANMIDSVLANATTPASAKSGAYFIMRLGNKAWCCGARAAVWGVTGKRNFLISQDGYIYYSEMDEDLTITTSGTPLGG